MLNSQFRQLNPRNPNISIRQFNALMQNVRSLSRSGGIDRVVGSGGIQQRRRLSPIVEDTWFLAKLTTGAATGPRYNVVEQEITSDETDTLVFGDLSEGRTVVATNLDELIASSKDLPVDGTIKVMIHILIDAGSADRYVFSGPAIVVD